MVSHQSELILCWLVGVSTVARFAAVIGASDILVQLYQYDDYDRCQMESPLGVYCLAKVILKQENSTELKITAVDTRFRRNLLERGICIAECQKELVELSETERMRYFQPKFDIDFVYTLSHYWKTDLDPIIHRYDKLSNICINQRLIRSYNITGYSELEHCSEYNSSEKVKLDLFKIAFAVVLLAIFLTFFITNIIAYVKDDATNENLIISAFSVRRNWARLIAAPKTDLHRDFAYIDGVRVMVCLGVLSMHSRLPFSSSPTVDQDLIERQLCHPVAHISRALEIGNVKIFLAITGLLLATHFLEDMRNNPKSGGFSYCARKVIYRLFRILPVYYVFLLHATVGDWIPGVDIGISGYKSLTTERHICRKYAWANLLFVNNFPFVDVICMGHTWYLATDMQLFLVGLLAIETIRKWPWILKPLLGAMIAVPACIIAGVVYFGRAEPFFVSSLSEEQLHFMTNRYFSEIYVPSYTNLGCFTSGIIVGFLYHYTKYHELKIQTYLLYKILKWLTIPVMLFVLSTVFVFVQYDIDFRQLWVAFFSICYFFSPVMVCCVLFIENFNQSTDSIRIVLSSKPMAILGKLTYSVYIVHIPALRIAAYFQPLMMAVTWMTLPGIWIQMIVVSYLLSVVLYFCLEQPAHLLLRGMLDSRCRGKKVV